MSDELTHTVDSVDPATESSRSDSPGAWTSSNEIHAFHRKVDKKILLWYCFVYLVMRIDVSNISNTAIVNESQGDGIKKQLGNLDSVQWAWVLSIFYYPYAAFEPISTLLLKRFRPSVWMSRIMMTWGIVSMCQGATQNYGGILAARFCLGLAEAGFYPDVLYHLSFWYPADSTALRIAFFYAWGQFSGTISGLLAYAIGFINGACAQLSGIVGPQVYQSRYGPNYKVSFEASIGLLAGAIACVGATWFIVAKRDRQA